MSKEIQLSNNYPAAADYWSQGQAAVGGPVNSGGGGSSAPRTSPLRRAHRLLRGRYPLAFLMAGIGAIAGCIALYTLLPPKWQSDGMISVNPMIMTPGLHDESVPLFTMVMRSQAALIESTSVAEEALKDPELMNALTKVYGSPSAMSATDFGTALTTDRQKDGNIIKVSFADKNKEVAQAGAHAAIRAYMKLYGDGDSNARTIKIKFNTDEQRRLNSDLSFARSQLVAWSQSYGTTDLGPLFDAMQGEELKLEAELDQATLQYKAATDLQSKKPTTNPNDREFIYKQIAVVDLQMRQLLAERGHTVDSLEQLVFKLGRKHPLYAAEYLKYQQANRAVEQYARDYLNAHAGQIPFGLDDPANGGGNLAMMKTKIDQLQSRLDDKKKQVLLIGELRNRIAEKQRDISKNEEGLKVVEGRIQSLEAEQKLAQSVHVNDYGSEAINTGDKKRVIAAGAGFMFGGLIPVGLLLLYGMTDARFRYSDETGESDMAGVTLLGILPNLPDRLSDPQQAGIAAHCVHQIRTMLQISRTNDEPQVIAVTSAAPGDGKTSLSLALGLSYAACGARTLLIDCDLVAAGLTHRLNVNSPEGVLEAVANRALLEFVRTTDIADVAILPVGTTHAHHASTLSPVALRRLLSESRKHFDVILVDTGPILGSIEASLVCAAADRTILTVARGQQRPLVERSIGHLQAIGARLAGVVFNRAQARDFERSLSGLALRSRPANGHAPANGPTATAVAGSFKRSA